LASRTPRDAVRIHLEQAQRLVSCVTDRVLRVGGERGPNERRTFSFPVGAVDLAGVRLKLQIRQHFRTFELVGVDGRRHTLISVGYVYALLDAAEREILSYHWHPHGRSDVTQPHLHLGPAAQIKQSDLASAHLPTGHISLPDIIQLAIESFGVVPRIEGWREVVAEARASR